MIHLYTQTRPGVLYFPCCQVLQPGTCIAYLVSSARNTGQMRPYPIVQKHKQVFMPACIHGKQVKIPVSETGIYHLTFIVFLFHLCGSLNKAKSITPGGIYY